MDHYHIMYLYLIERANVVATFGPSLSHRYHGKLLQELGSALAGVHFQNIGGLEERPSP
ncbi:MAG: hypothetical protein R2756_14770 [Bacteroidales bacterium]